MKGMFPEYENRQSENYEELWKNSLFVFDANVLLNLYRYRSTTKDELLAVLDEISHQVWIPHQVGLEFQRNRLAVIGEQTRKFSEVKRTIENAKSALKNEFSKLNLRERHSLIDPDPLISEIDNLTNKFFDDLEILRKSQQSVYGDDPLKNKIEAIFEGRMGSGFTKQEELDKLHKEGEIRYKYKIPPGFEDDAKDSKVPDEFMHAGLIYKRKYGDFILWRQMLQHCKDNKNKFLIFITDDAKSDWWRILDVDGPKVIGPRAELINEALQIGEVEQFFMYNSISFILHAKNSLKAKISDETIQEVKDISPTKPFSRQHQTTEILFQAYDALKDWLLNQSMILVGSQDRMVINAISAHKRITYAIAVAFPTKKQVNLYDRTSTMVASNIFDSPDDAVPENLIIVWIAINPSHASEIRNNLLHTSRSEGNRPLGVEVMIATLDDPETLLPGFFIQSEFSL
ncbi:PIN-like domain-containing protein [Janthinobacterium lividum]